MKSNRFTGKLRKMLSIILAVGFVMTSMTACGSNNNTGKSDSSAVSSDTAASTEPEVSKAAPTVNAARKTTANSEERYNKITIALSSDPSDLGPTGYGDNSAQYVLPNYFETLYDFRDNEYVPILAKGDPVQVDATHWDVEIYNYIKDSKGNNITADDIVFSYKTLIASGKAAKFDSFSDIKKVDDYTVEFTWTKPIDSVGELEWPLCRCFIVSQKAYEEGGMSSSPVGTGPYAVKEYDPGAKIVMEANDSYWQTNDLRDEQHLANVQTIEYDIISETSQNVIALSTDQIQYSEYVPAENMADFEEGGQYAKNHSVFATKGSSLEVLFPNCFDGKATADMNLRMAIFYALDNEAIAQTVGTYAPAKAFGTSFFGDYDVSWETASNNYMAQYDLEKAKDYLNKSGYKGETLNLLCSSDEASKTACTMIQTMLLQIGVNVKINSEDGNLVDTDMRDASKWDLLYKDIGGGSQIGEWNRPLNNTEFGTDYNLAMIKDDKMQSMLLKSSTLAGHTAENMTELHNYILDNAYYYGVCTPEMTGVYSNVFATLVYREHEFLRPGSCDYYLD